ncbi:GIY-YIG nuclease family protein [Litorilituus lipolyticus]|uniref:GIY-YIG nuclease family protein n=1 Tax=Litorilituus lipolyticus TaxID=2491017 RepID=A0A502KNV9_9GAMM|nr:GIY-YIG nuclease family protein [Litorilituus lipolyticus]TPH13252.1 GIY-YIG nuclease family protein [Litorilituus lipolyticus]
MALGRTIKIYLEDGSVSGIKHAEIVNWTGQAISCPRLQVKRLNSWAESQKPGVYFLYGINESTGKSAVYIGEAENVYERLQNHLAKKDFWNEVVFFTSKDENLTKAHVKHLEASLVSEAKIANRLDILNANTPQKPALPISEQSSMEEYFNNLKILLGVLGHKTLESLTKQSKDTESDNLNISKSSLRLEISNIKAKALLSDEGFIVLKGSQGALTVRKSLSNGYKKFRKQLIENQILNEVNGLFVFSQDCLFTSPSQAAAILVGYAINGRKHWIYESGESLKEREMIVS